MTSIHLYTVSMDEKRLTHQPPTPSDEWNATTLGFPEKQAISRRKTRNKMCSQRFEINKFHQLGHAQHISAPSAPLFCGLVPVVEALVLLWAAQRSSKQQLLSHWHGASTRHLSRSTVNPRILCKCLCKYIIFIYICLYIYTYMYVYNINIYIYIILYYIYSIHIVIYRGNN